MNSVPEDPVNASIDDVVKAFNLGWDCAGHDADKRARDEWWRGYTEALCDGLVPPPTKPCPYRQHRTRKTRCTTRPRTHGSVMR